MVTIKDVATAAGVSIATVSRVLSKSDYPVNPQTRERIFKAAKDLGYSVNRAARSLRTDQSFMVGVLLDNFESPWAPIIIRGLQDVFHQAGYFSLVVNIPWGEHSQGKVVKDLLGHSVDGFVFVETWHHASDNREMLGDKPYMMVHRLNHEEDPYSVIPDEHYNTSTIIQHLLDLGHQRIGYIKGDSAYFSSGERLNEYQNALSSAGIPINENYIKQGNWEISSGYRAAKELLSLASPPSAIAAGNDLMALGAIQAIIDSGLSVPEDIAVVGNDNDEVSNIVTPTITTVSMPLFEMGQITAQRLLNQLNGKEKSPEETLVKGELIVRQSCGSALGKNAVAHTYQRYSVPPIARPVKKAST
jgi:DNA-binding LacI/PurR family transcriptional regulator